MNIKFRSPKPEKKWLELRDLMNQALDSMPKHKGTVYRGTNIKTEANRKAFFKDIDESLNGGDPVVFKGFTSTSSLESKAWSGNIQIEIRNPITGVKVKPISQHASENEVLFPDGAKFEVISHTVGKFETHNIVVMEVL